MLKPKPSLRSRGGNNTYHVRNYLNESDDELGFHLVYPDSEKQEFFYNFNLHSSLDSRDESTKQEFFFIT